MPRGIHINEWGAAPIMAGNPVGEPVRIKDSDIIIKRGHEVLVDALPDCDVCKLEGYKPVRKARYDSNCRLGGWMNLCTTHFRDYGRGTGVGVGQRLIKRP